MDTVDDLAFEITCATSMSSRIKDRTNHPAYKQIVAMGKIAVPDILKRLAVTPLKIGHWEFAALRDIIGAGPDHPDDHLGRIHMIARDWLEWAKENGYSVGKASR